MAKRTLQLLGGAAVLGLVAALATSGVASAGPGGVHGLHQRVVTVRGVAVNNDTTEIQASCGPDEILTGGGYSVGSIGLLDKVFVNGPLNDKTWAVEVYVDPSGPASVDVWANAICVG